ncbi:molybdopterin-dependent oxidoreductase [Parahaliea maris]|uniref:Molybdopterin-dependent oxidoreductase n=1 Tax=Parahaliea maris TaxID=2716870 RepID=A0A5C9A5R6_9GAMM|nr:molybdopterin-dependent oxidoreductase [Parahaliea maris]TXS95342.1 molybdopterin-dependent oxidoreductase [Parahaliea maris]
MATTKTTFCRVCEPGCPLQAELEERGGELTLTRLAPLREHPLSRGFACHKGINFTEIHGDPDRLDYPIGKSAEGWARLDWETALRDIARRTQAVRDRHGESAVAGYIGNPTAFNSLGSEAIGHFFAQLGTDRIFSSGTQDCANKFAAAEAVYGTSTLHPIPDLGNTDYCLLFGENPKVSHMSFMSIFDPMAELRNVVKRGGKVKYINPRRIESATPRTGEVVQIRPDTDLYLMAALLEEMRRADLWRRDLLANHADHVEGLEAFVADFPAARVAPVVGLPAEDIVAMAMEFGSAARACVHMSTGVNMGRQGTLCYWLLQMLSLVTGNLDQRGGNLYSLGFYPAARAGRVPGNFQPFFDSPLGEIRYIRGALPGNLLAPFIRDRDEPVRALFVIAGNPLLSIGGEDALREAMPELELLVVIDLFRSATGELADFVLPATDMLERADINICGLGMQYVPHVQYTDAVVAPKAERREEWWILGRLLQAMGLQSPFDRSETPDPTGRLNAMLRYAGLSIDKLREANHHCVPLPDHETGHFFSEWLQTESGRVNCAPTLFGAALERARTLFEEMAAEPADTLKLISLRTNHMLNSWFHNTPYLKRDGFLDNPLHLSPTDADARQLHEGERIRVSSAWGDIETSVTIDNTLRAGTVAMTHGWGHSRTPGLRIASRHPGSNVNRLLPHGPDSFEKLSNQAHMTGITVNISPIDH